MPDNKSCYLIIMNNVDAWWFSNGLLSLYLIANGSRVWLRKRLFFPLKLFANNYGC